MRFFHWVRGGVDVRENEFEIVPAKLFPDGVARQVFGKQPRRGHDGLAKRLVTHFGSGRAVHIALQSE